MPFNSLPILQISARQILSRHWLYLGMALLVLAPNLLAKAPEEAEVVVVGATPGGIGAAVAAARSGASVILIEEQAHVGGVVAGGLVNADITNKDMIHGLFTEFTHRIREYYEKHYGAGSPQLKDCKEGMTFEPHVAGEVFNAMLAEQPRINVHLSERLTGVQKEGNKLTAIHVTKISNASDPNDAEMTVRGKVFVDATYEGDLAAKAGAAYRIGRESRDELGEPHAGVIYMNFSTSTPLPGSTGAADKGVEAFCFRFMLTDRGDNVAPIEKPATYHRADYRYLLEDIKSGKVTQLKDAMQLWPVPNHKVEINSTHPDPVKGVPSESFDLAEENWTWPEAGYKERERIFQRYWDYTEGLFWMLQHDEEVPEALRNEAKRYAFPKEEFTDHRYRPWQIYVREGRRIEGTYLPTEHDGDADLVTGKARVHPDSIAVAEYAFDCHGVHKYDPEHPGVREGYHYVKHAPFGLPYGIVVPKQVDGLLVPVACSSSHVAYQSIRMEPLFIILGEAAGIAAHMAAEKNFEVRAVPVDTLRAELVKRGGVVTPP
jgi:ribulose 1,5-bisphosphate synthetase/thiazole synthase